MSSPKICYLLKRYPRLSQTFILNELLALRRLGSNLLIVASKGADEEITHAQWRELDVPIYYLPPIPALSLDCVSVQKYKSLIHDPETLSLDDLRGDRTQKEYAAWVQVAMMAPLIQSLGVTHIHGHFATWSATAASMLSSMTGIPFSFTAHARDIFHETIDKKALAEKIEKAAFVITVSDFNKAYLDHLLVSDQRVGKVIRLYNGMNLKRLQKSNGEKNSDLILSVGRLVKKKGFHYLIEACNRLKKQAKSFRCVIIGEGQERGNLENLILKHDLQKEVTLHGALPQADVLEMLKKATVFVLPCIVDEAGDQDGLPTVILESMALGTPVISTDIAGIPEMITERQSGLLVAEKDSESLADAIERLLRSKLLREQYAEAARLRIERDFNIDKNAIKLKEYFSKSRRTLR